MGMVTSSLPSPDMEKMGLCSEEEPSTLSMTRPPMAPRRSITRAFSEKVDRVKAMPKRAQHDDCEASFPLTDEHTVTPLHQDDLAAEAISIGDLSAGDGGVGENRRAGQLKEQEDKKHYFFFDTICILVVQGFYLETVLHQLSELRWPGKDGDHALLPTSILRLQEGHQLRRSLGKGIGTL